MGFDESVLLAIVLIFNIYRAWAYSLVAVFIKFIFPVKFFGSLLGAQRFALDPENIWRRGIPRHILLFHRLSGCHDCLSDYSRKKIEDNEERNLDKFTCNSNK